MKKKATMTKCLAKNKGFYKKMRQLSGNRQQFVGLIAQKYTDYAINRGEVAPLEVTLTHPFHSA